MKKIISEFPELAHAMNKLLEDYKVTEHYYVKFCTNVPNIGNGRQPILIEGTFRLYYKD